MQVGGGREVGVRLGPAPESGPETSDCGLFAAGRFAKPAGGYVECIPMLSCTWHWTGSTWVGMAADASRLVLPRGAPLVLPTGILSVFGVLQLGGGRCGMRQYRQCPPCDRNVVATWGSVYFGKEMCMIIGQLIEFHGAPGASVCMGA